MSTQPQHENHPVAQEESRSQAVARRLRGKLAELRITQVDLAARLNTSQQYLSRRLTGAVAFDLDQIDGISAVTGIPVEYLLLGVKTENSPTPAGAGSDMSLLTESNRRPFHYSLGGCQVIPFPAPVGGDTTSDGDDAEIFRIFAQELETLEAS